MAFFGKTGGIIAAASKKDAVPLMKLGSIPIIKRIVLTLQQADVFPIVVVTGTEELEVTHQVAGSGVVFLRNEDCDQPELLTSVKLGLRYLQDKCERVVFTPVNTPMFSPETLRALLACDASVVTPSYHGQGGHPILLRNDMIGRVLAYEGGGGLRGVLAENNALRQWLPVEDAGILMSIHNERQLKHHLAAHNAALLSPTVQINIEKEQVLFNARFKLLLFLIADLQSVRQACLHMGLSYAKAWDMINRLEREVGYAVVERSHGGKQGGHTRLTPRGEALMLAYQRYEQEMKQEAQARFNKIFRESGLM